MLVLEIAVGATFASTRFSLVRISIRDLDADGKSLVRNSGVGDGGQNRILKITDRTFIDAQYDWMTGSRASVSECVPKIASVSGFACRPF